MKNSGSTGCCYLCYCYWSTILFVASSVVCVSPESSATRYPNQEQQQQQQQQKQQQQLVLQLEHQEARTSSASIDWPQNIDSSDIYHTKLVPTDELTIMLVQSAPKITVNSKSKIFAPNASTLYERNGKSESDVLVAAQRQSKIQFAPNYLNSNARTSSPIAAVSSISSASTTAVSASDHNFPLSQWQQYKSDMALFSIDKDTPTTLRSRRARQVADGEQMDKCRLFVEGELDKNEIYSPDYPNDYPKNINCTRIITAPKGQIIRLDFRNSFHIEAKEECKFDFLEIRDGQYGFSNLIGKYCGTDFPPEITSKERYLWLHFHSDESIEYSGFTAIYEFIDRNREAPSTDLNCTIEKDGYEGFINSTDVPQEIRETVIKNKIPLDCMWRIQVQDKWKIQVKFLDFKLSKPNDCETNFLDIFPEQTVMPLRVKNFCGSAGEGITSDSNILHMRFYAEQIAINSTFSILYTAFRDRGSAACIEEIEYDCEDATCISQELRCNGRDNCKFRWDEESCTEESTGQSEHVVIIIIVFGLILGGMVITFLVNCIRKIMRDQKIIREHIRQSKESKLDEMGRISKARSRDNVSVSMLSRQKHSHTSLQILDDVSNRYYREVLPIALQQTTKTEPKEEHSILRHHNDMHVQTSLSTGGDSSSISAEQPAIVDGSHSCDMGCQTRESLFASALVRQRSTASSSGGAGSLPPPPPHFSSFGYEAKQQQAKHSSSSIDAKHTRQQSETMDAHDSAHYHHRHHVPIAAERPQEQACHHHDQHRHNQQKQQQQNLEISHGQCTHTKQRMQQEHAQHSQRKPPQPHFAPTAATIAATDMANRTKQQHKANEPKDLIDIRNSAPDVIIMTSH